MEWSYQYEKFTHARRALMLPHPQGEAESVVIAFHECGHGLRGVNVSLIEDDRARELIAKIETAMNTEGLTDTTGRGLFYERAETMTTEEKSTLSDAVDELTSWFSRKFWGAD